MKKYMCIILAIITIILAVCFIIYYKFFRTAKEFILDSEDKYIITTNHSTMTAMSDGGTHYDIRYNVDLGKRKVTIVQDYYKGFEGYKYKNRILFEKKLSAKEVEQIKELFNEIKENNSGNNNGIFVGYKLEHINDEPIVISSREYIDRIEELLEK